MCRAVQCSKCGKTTWAGCGAHVDQVMAAVPPKNRCECERTVAAPGASLWDSIKRAIGGTDP